MPIASLAPLPERLLHLTTADGELVPTWLGARDVPWLRDLLHDARAFVGRPFGELLARWRQSDPDPRAGAGGPVARHVLQQWLRPERGDERPRQWRRELFAAVAAGEPADRALAALAERADRPAAALRAALFADLPDQRPVAWPVPGPTPLDVAHAANRCLAATLLQRAESCELELLGASRAVLRTAWLHGTELVAAPADLGRVQLRWRPAGRRAPLPGRALAALVPVLPWTRHFVLRARCRWRGEVGTLVLDSTTALLPGPAPQPFDSALERDLAAACAVLAPELDLVREPAPLPRGDQLAFPDFLVRRRGGEAVAWLEVAGDRVPAAMAGKLALLASEPRYVLCAPRRLGLPAHPRLVPFGRRIDARAVLRVVRSLP